MPSLRDSNPLIDHDLSSIIATFELGMFKSTEEESTIAPFRSDLMASREIPISILGTATNVPVKGSSETTGSVGVSRQTINDPSSTISDNTDFVSNNPPSGKESSNLFGIELPETVNEEWKKKLLKVVNECIPCDLRVISKFDPKLIHKSVLDSWEGAIDGLKKVKNDFKKHMYDKTTIYMDFCSLGKYFKFQCIPDLEKMAWLLNFVLGQIMQKFYLDLSFFDRFVTAILGPIFNELMTIFNLTKDLMLAPAKCIADTTLKMMEMPQKTSTAFGTASNQTLGRLENMLPPEVLKANLDRVSRIQENIDGSQSYENMKTKLNAINQEEVTPEKYRQYLMFGIRWIENKIKHYTDIFKEIVDRNVGMLDSKMSANSSKMELVRLINIIGATIKAGKEGKLDCGVMSDPFTEDDARNISAMMNQNTPIETVVEDGKVIIKWNPKRTTTQSQQDRSNTRLQQEISSSGNVPRIQQPSNIVMSKSIESCLKKVTEEQASQVRLWIRQLEEEVVD